MTFNSAFERTKSAAISPCTLAARRSTGSLERIAAAIKIGRVARRFQMNASVALDHKCMSACVFILAGAVHRYVGSGAVGIHRPYPESTDDLPLSEVERRYKELAKRVREYFEEMNMPPSLAEAVLRVPPGKIQVLTEREARGFMLIGTDPVTEEQETVRGARKWNLDRAEYLRREHRYFKECHFLDLSSLSSLDECERRIMTEKR